MLGSGTAQNQFSCQLLPQAKAAVTSSVDGPSQLADVADTHTMVKLSALIRDCWEMKVSKGGVGF